MGLLDADDEEDEEASYSDDDVEIGTGMIHYFDKKIAPLGDLYLKALKEQIDIDGQLLFDNIKKNCPRQGGKDTHELAESLTIEKIDNAVSYGYIIDFPNIKLNDKRVKQDRPGLKPNRYYYVSTTTYHDLAYFLEVGAGNMKATHFIAKQIRKLKGLDDRIVARFEKMAQELEEK